MTNTLPASNSVERPALHAPQRRDRKTAVGLQPHKRTGDRYRHGAAHPARRPGVPGQVQPARPAQPRPALRRRRRCSPPPAPPRVSSSGSRACGKPPTRLKSSGKDYFDLTPDDDQKMIVETVNEFAAEILRPAAHDADEAADLPAELIAKAAELGITAINIPEDFDGIAEHRTTVTNALVAEALAYGDMGLALPILAPGGVASALTHWGSADQQATYLTSSPARTSRRPAWRSPSRTRCSTRPR